MTEQQFKETFQPIIEQALKGGINIDEIMYHCFSFYNLGVKDQRMETKQTFERVFGLTTMRSN